MDAGFEIRDLELFGSHPNNQRTDTLLPCVINKAAQKPLLFSENLLFPLALLVSQDMISTYSLISKARPNPSL